MLFCMMGNPRRGVTLVLVIPVLLISVAASAAAANRAELWERWTNHDADSNLRVDHGAWTRFLEEYVLTATGSGVNLFRYADVTAADRRLLNDYIRSLSETPISEYRRDEQMAYWINLYNALTIQIVLDHYPVDSIRDIRLSGLFRAGPWDAEMVEVEGIALTLNDIEHRILRPIWADPRVHYAVNCASIGCPNLQPQAYTADNVEELLDEGARDYVNHPRGVTFSNGTLTVSSIYDWFQEDFGGSVDGVIDHLGRHAHPALAARLAAHDGRVRFAYDWNLNDASR